MRNIGNEVQFAIYQSQQTNPFPVQYEDWEKNASDKLTSEAFDYIAGGAGSDYTVQANVDRFRAYNIVPRMFRNVEERDLSVDLFGQTYPFPVLQAPIGVQSIIHEDKELGSARACAKLGVPYIASSAASTSLEDIAEAMGDQPRWFQLYWSRDEDIAASFLQRAERAGYSAIVITLDTPMMAWREKDLTNAYLPFLKGEGVANYLSDPAFRAKLEKPPEEDPQAAIEQWSKVFGNATLTWEDLSFIRQHTTLPIILKGILHPEDAKLAVEAHVDGIIVSNHGGRQVDGSITAIDALPEIADVVRGRVPILLDSGIRRGADVLKALALGATAVLVGRPSMYALAVGGEEGVETLFKQLVADVDLTLALAGGTNVRHLDKEFLQSSYASSERSVK
ncbi:lactate 2-monooxygenase [Bacillaceae bacterium JMAK1]|nr:lactate 2-monooxygenase [Bacillaceae bacterium JMAK1]